jgi:hypothetical protein
VLDRHTDIAVAGDPHDVVAELRGIRPCHGDILSACPRPASHLSCHLFVQQTRRDACRYGRFRQHTTQYLPTRQWHRSRVA